MERHTHRILKINEDIANANRKIVQQNAELLAAIRANERIRRNRNRANRNLYVSLTIVRNVWRHNNDVNEAERRIQCETTRK